MKFSKIRSQIQKRGQRANFGGDEMVLGTPTGPSTSLSGYGQPLNRGFADPMQQGLSRPQQLFTLTISNTNTAAGTTPVTLFGSVERADANIADAGTGVTVSSGGQFDYATILRQLRDQPRAIQKLQITYSNILQKANSLSYIRTDPAASESSTVNYFPSTVFTGYQQQANEIVLDVDMVLNQYNAITFNQINGANGTMTIVFWASSIIKLTDVLTGQSPLKV